MLRENRTTPACLIVRVAQVMHPDWHEQAQREPESLQGGRPRAAGRRYPPGAQQAEARAESRSGAVRDAAGSSGRNLAGRPVDISERALRLEHAAGDRFEWRDDLEPGDEAASNRRCSASSQADRDSPLAERSVYREEAIHIHYEVAGHQHKDAIKENRETAIPSHCQEVCRIRWKEGVRRQSEATFGFPTEVIRPREEPQRSRITQTDGGSLSPEKRRSDESSGLAFKAGGPVKGRRNCRRIPADRNLGWSSGRRESRLTHASMEPGRSGCPAGSRAGEGANPGSSATASPAPATFLCVNGR